MIGGTRPSVRFRNKVEKPKEETSELKIKTSTENSVYRCNGDPVRVDSNNPYWMTQLR